MQASRNILDREITEALRSWRRGRVLRGIAIVLTALTLGLSAVILLRGFWWDAPWLIPGIIVLTLAATLFLLVKYLILPFREKANPRLVARTIETQNSDLEDRLITAVEKSAKSDDSWTKRLVADARAKTQGLNFRKQMRVGGYRVWQTLFFASIIILSVLFLKKNTWEQDFRGMLSAGFVPPKPPPELRVLPGDVHLERGSALEVSATLRYYDVDDVSLFFVDEDSNWTSVGMDIDPRTDAYAYEFFDMRKPLRYYVKAEDEISRIYDVSLFDTPKVKRIDLTYIFPKYTGFSNRIEPDAGDIWAPIGTTVKVTVLSATPIVKSELLIGESQKNKMELLSDTTAVGYLKIKTDTYYRIHLMNKEQQDNAPMAEYYVHALKDKPPQVTLARPGSDTKATMLEEVSVTAKISNDYGLESAKIVITINTDSIVTAPLKFKKSDGKARSDFGYKREEYEGLIYLEDLNVKPGDFITYQIEAKDARHPTPATSEMYFIDVRRFDEIYRAQTSQGGSGGGGGGEEFYLYQRDIISATQKLLQRQDKISGDELKRQIEKVHDAQKSLHESVADVIKMMNMRMGFVGDANEKVQKELEQARDAMKDARELLAQDSLKAALKPERKAYHHLMKANSLNDERVLQMSQGGSGGGGSQNTDELSRLFQEELDKLRNKYESLEQGDRAQEQQAVNDALQKIKELARRQQNINEQNRTLSQREVNEEEKKREIKKLRRQQEQLNRDMQEAMQQVEKSLQKQQEAAGGAASDMQKASDAMNQSSRDLQQGDPQNAAASGQQALDRLKKLEDRLKKTQRDAVKNELKSLSEDLRNLAEQERRLAEQSGKLQKAVDSIMAGGGNTREKRAALREQIAESQRQREQQQAAHDKLENALNDMREITTGANDNPEFQRQMRDLSKSLQEAETLDKMQRSDVALQRGRFSGARLLQESAAEDLAQSAKEAGKLSEALGDSPREKLASAHEEIQDARSGLENKLREKLAKQQGQSQSGEQGKSQGEEQARSQGEQEGESQGEEQGQSQGKQEGQSQGEGESQSGEQGKQQGEQGKSGENGKPSRKNTGKPRGGGRLSDQDMSELREALWGTQQKLQNLQDDFSQNPEQDENGRFQNLQKMTNDLSVSLSGFLRNFSGGDAKRLQEIAEQIIDPLHRIETEIETQLQLMRGDEALQTVKDQPLPPEFRALIEEYYRKLAETKKGK